MTTLTEADVEAAALDWLAALGWGVAWDWSVGWCGEVAVRRRNT